MRRLALISALAVGVAACSSGSPPAGVQQAQVTTAFAAAGSPRAQVNAIRASAGRSAIARDATLDAVARGHANDMATRNFFSHTGSNGSNVGQRASRAGYRWCAVAENIARGQSSETAAIEGWRTSPGHYANLVGNKYRAFGLAQVGDVYVMVLGAKRC